MPRLLSASLLALLLLTLCACASDSSSPPLLVSTILSDPAYDGDIQDASIVVQGRNPSLLAGIDPVSNVEYRAFLHFPLSGGDGVPADAIIASASIDIYINNLAIRQSQDTMPLRIDLVDLDPPFLVWSDFDRLLQLALATTTLSPPISVDDLYRYIRIDVTPLMVEAQRAGLANFQVRILEGLDATVPALIEINDTTATFAPLLTVNYY